MEPLFLPDDTRELKQELDVWTSNLKPPWFIVTTELIPRDKHTLAYTVYVRRPRKGELSEHSEK